MKPKKRLIWLLFFPFLLITALAVVATAWLASTNMSRFYKNRTAVGLESTGRAVMVQLEPLVLAGDQAGIDALCKKVGRQSTTRLTMMDLSGVVLGDTDEVPASMENHANRPEMRQALAGTVGMQIRFSATLQQKMMYVAIPMQVAQRPVGILRCSIPIEAIDKTMKAFRWRIAVSGLFLMFVLAGVSLAVSRRISLPIEQMRAGAQRFGEGDFDHRLPVQDAVELAVLSETLNRMARQINERINESVEQQRKSEAVLSSMLEGVVAIDSNERVISLNQAAARMMDTDAQLAAGRLLPEVMRDVQLQHFVRRNLEHDDSAGTDISLHKPTEKILNAHCSPLFDADNQRIGLLVVLSDVTQLRRLENMRKDFAANVSHEIKTPLTAIKGFVETLLHGDVQAEEERSRFLGIIEKHVQRLADILEDLMKLSRIEQSAEQNELHFDKKALRNVIQDAMAICRPLAEERKIQFELTCPDDLQVCMDPILFEQALTNLLDNAVKYSGPDSPVHINVTRQDKEVRIAIRDHGIGIAQRHLPRLFERFYRVDKARTRALGGTGLGLSIVKHVVQAHGGHVQVESVPASGSTFTIHLPLDDHSWLIHQTE